MNRASTAIAVSAIALSAAALGATNAAATHPADNGTLPTPAAPYGSPDCHWAYHSVCNEVPGSEHPVEAAVAPSPSDNSGAETMQLSASALGGAGIALGAVWIYRRRQAING
jgi:hypothetical protein